MERAADKLTRKDVRCSVCKVCGRYGLVNEDRQCTGSSRTSTGIIKYRSDYCQRVPDKKKAKYGG